MPQIHWKIGRRPKHGAPGTIKKRPSKAPGVMKKGSARGGSKKDNMKGGPKPPRPPSPPLPSGVTSGGSGSVTIPTPPPAPSGPHGNAYGYYGNAPGGGGGGGQGHNPDRTTPGSGGRGAGKPSLRRPRPVKRKKK